MNVEGETLSVVVMAPSPDGLPERKPAITPSGKATTKKMTKADLADAHLTLICGHLLLTIKEAFAVAPGIQEVKAVVVRNGLKDVYGDLPLEVLLAASYSREQLRRVDWANAHSPQIVEQAARNGLMNLKGRPPALRPIDLAEQPELEAFVTVLAGKLESATA